MSKRFLITILIICSIFKLYASLPVDSILVFADKQYIDGNYKSAIKEYLRIGFYSGFSDPTIQLRLANCYYQNGDWATARLYYDQVSRLTRQDSLIINSRLSKISSLISEKKYKQALVDLYNINDSVYQKHHVEIDVLFGICYFGLEEFDKSKSYFKNAVNNNLDAQERIDSVFACKKLFKRPNSAVAFTMSLILPGLGQMYSGDMSDGLNSFLLTESLLFLGVMVSFNYSIIDAVFSVLPWYQRYYMGGLTNTAEVADRKRQENRSTAYKKVINIVRNNRE